MFGVFRFRGSNETVPSRPVRITPRERETETAGKKGVAKQRTKQTTPEGNTMGRERGEATNG